MSREKKIETLMIQLQAFAEPNAERLKKARIIENEYNYCVLSDKYITDIDRVYLNKVLHATRAFDSGLRLFLFKMGCLGDEHSIGEYVTKLQKSGSQKFKQLDGNLAVNIKNEVTDKRNRYMHAAGAFPSAGESEFIVTQTIEYLIRVLSLEKK